MERKKLLSERNLVQMLEVCGPESQRDFLKFLACSLFNRSPLLSNLTKELVRSIESGEPALFEDFALQVGMSVRQLNKNFSLLTEKLELYLSLESRLEEPASLFPDLLKSLGRSGFSEKMVMRTFKKCGKKINKTPLTTEQFHARLRLAHQMAEYRTSNPRTGKPSDYQEHLGLLNAYFVITQLKYACAIQNLNRVYGKEKEKEDSSVAEFPVVIAEAEPLAVAYFLVLNLLKNPELPASTFWKLHAHLKSNSAKIDKAELVDLYGYLLNATLRRINSGSGEFLLLSNQVYESMLKLGLLSLGGSINPAHFKNYVSLHARARDFEGCRSFIEEQGNLLPAKSGPSLVRFCIGLLAFYEGNYRKGLNIFRVFSEQGSDDLFFSLEARSLLWKCYLESFEGLEMKERTKLDGLYDSFRMYVRRSKRLSDYHRESYQGFIRVYNKLKSWLESRDRNQNELQVLWSEVKSMDRVSHKKWLLETIERRMEEKSSGN